MKEEEAEFSLGRCWLVFAVVFFLGICVAVNMMKASPIFPVLMGELGFTESNIGFMMSSFTIMGIVLAFPANGLLQKLGIKAVLIAVCVPSLIGAVLGAVATDATVMMIARFVEGIGLGLVTVAGPAAVSFVMPDKMRGLAMGIFSLWFPAGITLVMFIVPTMSGALGWRAVWWVTAVLFAIGFVLVFLFYAEPSGGKATVQSEGFLSQAGFKADYFSIICASLAYMAFNTLWGGAVSSFYPTYLQLSIGLDAQQAGMVAAIPNVILLILCPIVGTVSDKLHTRKWIALAGMVILIPLITVAFAGTFSSALVFVIVVSIPVAAISTCVYAIVPDLAGNPKSVGLALGIMAFFQNIGMAVGSAAFGSINSYLGWQGASFAFLLPLAIVSLVLCLLIREKPIRTRPIAEKENRESGEGAI